MVQVQASSVVASNFRGPYDLLLLDAVGSSQELLRANYLSSVEGSIDRRVADVVARVPGVEQVAPLAIVGSTLLTVVGDFDVSDVLLSGGPGYYLLETHWLSEGGRTTYPNISVGVYFDPDREMSRSTCPPARPPVTLTWACIGAADTFFSTGGYPSQSGEWATFGVYLYLPIVVAAIEPRAESDMFGTSVSAIEESTSSDSAMTGLTQVLVPAAFASRLEVDTTPLVSFSRVDLPAEVGDRFLGDDSVFDFSRSLKLEQAPDLQRTYTESLAESGELTALFLLESGSVTYDAADVLDPTVVADSGLWAELRGEPPPGNLDIQFRPTTLASAVPFALEVQSVFTPPSLVADVQLAVGTYQRPIVTMSDGTEIGPTMNVGGYLQQSPTALVTRDAADALTNQMGLPPVTLSSIRVRVDDAHANPRGLAAVAERIAAETALAVRPLSGSTVGDESVRLPASLFGRPELIVEEQFVLGGSALRATQSLKNKRLLSYALVAILGSIGFFFVSAVLAQSRDEDRRALNTAGVGRWNSTRIMLHGTAGAASVGAIGGFVALALFVAEADYLTALGAATVGIGAFVAGALVPRDNRTDAFRIAVPRHGPFHFALSELLNRRSSRLWALVLLGFTSATLGVIVGLHFQLARIQVGNQVEVLDPTSQMVDLLLALALVLAALVVVRSTALAARQPNRGEPLRTVALRRGTVVRLRLLGAVLVSVVVALIAVISVLLLLRVLDTGLTAGSIVATVTVCLVGTGASEA